MTTLRPIIIYASAQITAGTYLLLRTTWDLEDKPLFLIVFLIVGSIAGFFVASWDLIIIDIKRIIAFSTISQFCFFLGFYLTVLEIESIINSILFARYKWNIKILLNICISSLQNFFKELNSTPITPLILKKFYWNWIIVLVRLFGIIFIYFYTNILNFNNTYSWFESVTLLRILLFNYLLIFPLFAGTLIYGAYKYKNYKFNGKFYHFIYLFNLLINGLCCINILLILTNIGFPSFVDSSQTLTAWSILFYIFNFIISVKSEFVLYLDLDLNISGLKKSQEIKSQSAAIRVWFNELVTLCNNGGDDSISVVRPAAENEGGLPDYKGEDGDNNKGGDSNNKNNNNFKNNNIFIFSASSYIYIDQFNHIKPSYYLSDSDFWLFHIESAVKRLNPSDSYFWSGEFPSITYKEFLAKLNKLGFPPVVQSQQGELNIDWSFHDRAYRVLSSIDNLDPQEASYLSIVYDRLNQSAEYSRVFLDQNRESLVEFDILDTAIQNIRNRHFEQFLRLPPKCQDYILWTIDRKQYNIEKGRLFYGPLISKLNFDVLYMINQELRPFNTYSRFYHNLDFAYGSSHRSGFLKQLELYSERLEANRRAQLGWYGNLYPLGFAAIFGLGLFVRKFISTGVEIVVNN